MDHNTSMMRPGAVYTPPKDYAGAHNKHGNDGSSSSGGTTPSASPTPQRRKLFRRRQSVEQVARRWRISFEESLLLCANFEHQQTETDVVQDEYAALAAKQRR